MQTRKEDSPQKLTQSRSNSRQGYSESKKGALQAQESQKKLDPRDIARVRPEYGPDVLKIQSQPDENEFGCYNNSFLSQGLKLPQRKLCPCACYAMPGYSDIWLVTEIIQATGEEGDLANHYLDNGERKRLNCQVVCSLVKKNQERSVWDEHELLHKFTYSSYDPKEIIDKNKISVWFFDNRPLDIFQITITPNRKYYLTISELKWMRFPQGSDNYNFISKELAIYKDSENNFKLHNPLQNQALGSLNVQELDQLCIRDSLLVNKSYPDQVLFMKKWRENKVYSFTQEDFVKGNFSDYKEIPDLKFPEAIEEEDSGNFWIFSQEGRLVLRNFWGNKGQHRFFDTKGKTVALDKPNGCAQKYFTPVTILMQTAQDANSKKSSNNLQNGNIRYIDGVTMEEGVTYYQHNTDHVHAKGIFSSAKVFDMYSKKMVEVCYNFNGPIHQVSCKKLIYTEFSLQRGKRAIYEQGTLYAHIYANQIHQLNCLTQEVKITQLDSNLKVLTAMKFGLNDSTFKEVIYRAGFLLYDFNSKQLVALAADKDSRQLKRAYNINYNIQDGLTKDVHSCVLICFGNVQYLIFQQKEQITYYAFRKETKVIHREALPIEMQVDKRMLYYTRKNKKGAYEIIQANYLLGDEPETIIGTDMNQIIATCCIATIQNTKIAALNSQMQIKVYQQGEKTMKFYANIALDSFNFGIPLNFPQFSIDLRDSSIVFNGRDYFSYNSKEEAELYKPVEEDIYSQFKVNQKDYTSHVLTESLNANTFHIQKAINVGADEAFLAELKSLADTSTYESTAKSEKMLADSKRMNSQYEVVPILHYSINRTESVSIKRGLNQQIFTVAMEEDVKGVHFDKISQSFLVLFSSSLQVFTKNFEFLSKVDLEELLVDRPEKLQIKSVSFEKAGDSELLITNPEDQVFSLCLDLIDLLAVKITSLKKYQEKEENPALAGLKKFLENDEISVVDVHQFEEKQYLVQTFDKEDQVYYLSLVEQTKKDSFIQRKRNQMSSKATIFQDLDEFGCLVHTKDCISEFFTATKAFQFSEFESQIEESASNQERTMMIARDNQFKKNILIQVSNTKELSRYSQAIENPSLTSSTLQNMKQNLLTQINPDTLRNLFLTVGLRKVDQLKLLNDNIQNLKETGNEEAYKAALKMIFYPLREMDKQDTEAWDTFSLVILKDLKGAGELLINNIAQLLSSGEEINSLVIKDLKFFETLFNYTSFPELLNSVQGEQEIVEVYDCLIPEEGSSFLSKKPFLTKEIIQEKVGQLEGEGQKSTVYMRKLQLDFLLQEGVIADYCSLFDKINDDKILGNVTLELIIGEIWRKTQPKVLKYIFLPYMIYCFLFITYISFMYNPYTETGALDYCILVPCVLFSGLQLFMEANQMIREGRYYFASVGVIWNIMDIFSSVLVSSFIFMILTGQNSNPNTYIIGGLGVFFLWLKLFYFMRMFSETAAFVRMIIEMFLDIKIFLLIFFVGILAFSNCFYILDMYTKLQKSDHADGETYESITGETYIDAFKYVYLQSLGELGYDGYDSSYAPSIYWIFFFASSLFLQITLLNLLIAIMGDTFDRIQEVQREAKTKEICSILSEYSFLIPQESIAKHCCIYVASYENQEDFEGQGGWEGKLTTLKNFFIKQVEKLGVVIDKSTERLESKHIQNRKTMTSMIDQIQGSLGQMRTEMDNKEEKQDKIIVFLKEIQEKMDKNQEKIEREITALKEKVSGGEKVQVVDEPEENKTEIQVESEEVNEEKEED